MQAEWMGFLKRFSFRLKMWLRLRAVNKISEKIWPGYILVKMILTDDFGSVSKTNGFLGF